MKRTWLTVALFLGSWGMLTPPAHAVIMVEDVPHLLQSIASQVVNYIQYVSHDLNQLTQIAYQVEQLEYQVIALKRFGDPQYYVHLLHLDDLMASASALQNGVGDTVGAFSQNADGYSALGYTNYGIYPNYQGLVDRYGDPLRWEQDAFRKFGAINDAYTAYNRGMVTYNQQLRALETQLADAQRRLNDASTQMETEKYLAQIEMIKAQMDALAHQSALKGQQLTIQHFQNQNAAARSQEAERQQLLQERATELKRGAAGLGAWIGGPQASAPGGGPLP